MITNVIQSTLELVFHIVRAVLRNIVCADKPQSLRAGAKTIGLPKA